MPPNYEQVLTSLTGPTKTSQFLDDRYDLLPVNPQHHPFLQATLISTNSPIAQDPNVWHATTTKWIAFLSATCPTPSPILSPLSKKFRWGDRPESAQDQRERFNLDRRTKRSLQCATWRLLDNLEALSERWPKPARLILNRIPHGPDTLPFQSLVDDFHKERRWNSVWASFVTFLLHAFDDNALPEMGLRVPEYPDCDDDGDDDDDSLENTLIDIQEALLYENYPIVTDDSPGLIEDKLHTLFLKLLVDPCPSPESNPLQWWLNILIRSALADGPDDYISRGRFSSNILAMDLDIRDRIEALLHFSKVLLLDHAFNSWKPSPESLKEVQDDLNRVDITWIGTHGGDRPDPSLDRRTYDSPAWQHLLTHLENELQGLLSPTSSTITGYILRLLQNLPPATAGASGMAGATCDA
jgi:hypothetical protein